MQCMKCGREVEAGQVFCPECLAVMEQYPVKPGTIVQLPPHTGQVPVKKQPVHYRKPALPLEEQVKLLRKRLQILSLALVLALTALGVLMYLSVKDFLSKDTEFLPGQNYSSVTSVESGRIN